MPTEAIRQREHHEGEEAHRELGVLRGPRLDLLPDDGVGGQRPWPPSRLASAASEICESMSSIAIEPSVDLELAQVADDHARVLAGDVAEDHVALGLLGGAGRGRSGCMTEGVSLSRSSACPALWLGTTIRRWTIAASVARARAHRLSPAPAPRRARAPAEELLHRGERRPLPRGRRGGRDRGARRLRAHPPLHARRSSVWRPPVLGGAGARRPRRLLRVRAHDPAAARDRGRLRPGREDRDRRRCSTRTTSTTWSARSTSSATWRSTTRATTSGRRDGDPDAVWRRYFETLAEAARSGLFDILAHPDLVKVWGAGRPLPERRPALLLRARGRGDRRDRDRGRGLDRRTAQAGRRALSGAGASRRCASRPARSSRSPPTRTSPSRSASPTSARSSSCASWGSTEICVFERPPAPAGAAEVG